MEILEQLIRSSRIFISNCPSSFRRGLHENIDWNDRLIGITGARGVGKTTLMLQHLRDLSGNHESGLYIPLDHPLISSHSLYEIIDLFVMRGGNMLFVDEVHKYHEWSSHIKAIYDAFPKLKIIFSGSSALHLHKGKGDLSRRAVMYKMAVLSFREFLEIESGIQFQSFPLEEILKDHEKIAGSINKKVRPLQYFGNYFEYGCYPFYLEGEKKFSEKLQSIINQVLESDLVIINNIEGRYISKLKKLLGMISESLPYQPNILKLSEVIEISRPLLYQYLEYLQDANLICMLRPHGKGYSTLVKPEKIYLENPNLIHSLSGGKSEIGTMRETFFINQVRSHHLLEASPAADFLVDEKWTFEIGGKNKSFVQLKNVKNSFLVSDNIDCGINNRIPLWLFGFLY